MPFTTHAARGRAELADANAELGDEMPEWVDIRRLDWQLSSTMADGVGMALRFEIGALPPEVQPRPATAYGVVLDTNGDGVADYIAGMDNVGGGSHREWITDVSSGTQSVNNSEGYGYGAYDTFTDTYFPGESRLQILVGRQATTGERSLRFYFWASTVVDGGTVTDFAPDDGWVTFRPTATQ